ncbi:hypothetical protein EXD98_15140 [Acinetobacter pittii]|uniref:Uncharacterized protein n=1 Tax=Acinetobacter pittii TaxID=48296 RepID=A0AAE8G7G5_ACIPI|nr:hypothetical protein [Acinetobacter pittii]RZH26520.1 hypothetical protein EXD98_15140 [Acinetobacter pittii]
MIKLGNQNFNFQILPGKMNDKLIPIRIYINGNILGDLEYSTYMPSFLAEIKSVIKDSYYYKGDFNKDSFYEILKEAVDDVEKGYKITLEETFDDFIKRVGRNDNEVFFLWCLQDNCDSKYNRENIGKIVFTSISISDYMFASNELFKWARENMSLNYSIAKPYINKLSCGL